MERALNVPEGTQMVAVRMLKIEHGPGIEEQVLTREVSSALQSAPAKRTDPLLRCHHGVNPILVSPGQIIPGATGEPGNVGGPFTRWVPERDDRKKYFPCDPGTTLYSR